MVSLKRVWRFVTKNKTRRGQFESNSLIAQSSTVSMDPKHAVTAAAQVFNIPELLELILKNLKLRDLLCRASLACRAFKTSIDTSPSINKRLQTVLIDVLPMTLGWYESAQISSSMMLHTTGPFLSIILSFKKVSLERFLSSPSFCKIQIPIMLSFPRGRLRVAQPGGDKYWSECRMSESNLDDNPTTIASLLQAAKERIPTGSVKSRHVVLRFEVDNSASKAKAVHIDLFPRGNQFDLGWVAYFLRNPGMEPYHGYNGRYQWRRDSIHASI